MYFFIFVSCELLRSNWTLTKNFNLKACVVSTPLWQIIQGSWSKSLEKINNDIKISVDQVVPELLMKTYKTLSRPNFYTIFKFLQTIDFKMLHSESDWHYKDIEIALKVMSNRGWYNTEHWLKMNDLICPIYSVFKYI